ncbi:MAG: hypothetical protein ACYTAN_10700 [Planctomycetota bacterium]|jgi:hypothetical protein
MLKILKKFGRKMARRNGNGKANGRAAGMPRTSLEQVEAAQRLFYGCVMLDGNDPFAGDRAAGLPFVLFGGNVERRDTS